MDNSDICGIIYNMKFEGLKKVAKIGAVAGALTFTPLSNTNAQIEIDKDKVDAIRSVEDTIPSLEELQKYNLLPRVMDKNQFDLFDNPNAFPKFIKDAIQEYKELKKYPPQTIDPFKKKKRKKHKEPLRDTPTGVV